MKKFVRIIACCLIFLNSFYLFLCAENSHTCGLLHDCKNSESQQKFNNLNFKDKNAPSLVQGTALVKHGKDIIISWDINYDAIKYVVYKSINEARFAKAAESTLLIWTDINTAGDDYLMYYVCALNEKGEESPYALIVEYDGRIDANKSKTISRAIIGVSAATLGLLILANIVIFVKKKKSSQVSRYSSRTRSRSVSSKYIRRR
ncbi:MAG: hypothetical protein LBU60_02045 [Clostridiales bacterium]|jgi:hypothetical protein|nr:hypothetical protein [Clostridiales bacterium]